MNKTKFSTITSVLALALSANAVASNIVFFGDSITNTNHPASHVTVGNQCNDYNSAISNGIWPTLEEANACDTQTVFHYNDSNNSGLYDLHNTWIGLTNAAWKWPSQLARISNAVSVQANLAYPGANCDQIYGIFSHYADNWTTYSSITPDYVFVTAGMNGVGSSYSVTTCLNKIITKASSYNIQLIISNYYPNIATVTPPAVIASHPNATSQASLTALNTEIKDAINNWNNNHSYQVTFVDMASLMAVSVYPQPVNYLALHPGEFMPIETITMNNISFNWHTDFAVEGLHFNPRGACKFAKAVAKNFNLPITGVCLGN